MKDERRLASILLFTRYRLPTRVARSATVESGSRVFADLTRVEFARSLGDCSLHSSSSILRARSDLTILL